MLAYCNTTFVHIHEVHLKICLEKRQVDLQFFGMTKARDFTDVKQKRSNIGTSDFIFDSYHERPDTFHYVKLSIEQC